MESGTSTAGTETVSVSRTRTILFSLDSLDNWIFSDFGVSHFALLATRLRQSCGVQQQHAGDHHVEILIHMHTSVCLKTSRGLS